jgi:hypothetical protein
MLFLRYYFWIAPHVLLGVVLFVFLRRGLQKHFPLFFSYVLFEVFQFLVGFAIAQLPTHPLALYTRIHIYALIVGTLLKFGVIYEISRTLFARGSVLSGTVLSLMQWISGILLLTTTFAAATLTGAQLQSLRNVFITLELSTNVIFGGLLLLIFLFARLFHISWRSHVAGFALGFGVFAALEIATTALREASADSGNIIIDLVQMAAYHISTVIWLSYLLWIPKPVKPAGIVPQKPELELWDQELQRMRR